MRWMKYLLAVAVVAVTAGTGTGPRAQPFRLLELDGAPVKWGDGQAGGGAVVSYRTVGQPVSFPDGINCPFMNPIARLADGAGPRAIDLPAELRAAMRLWEAAANIRFREAPDMESADLLIGVQRDPRGIAYTGIRFDRRRNRRFSRITRAAICLNPRAVWETEPDGSTATYGIARVLAHEIGHVIGLDHPGPRGQLMGYRYSEDPAVLNPGDIAGARLLYGPPTGGPR